jgi:hypothetical protein
MALEAAVVTKFMKPEPGSVEERALAGILGQRRHALILGPGGSGKVRPTTPHTHQTHRSHLMGLTSWDSLHLNTNRCALSLLLC